MNMTTDNRKPRTTDRVLAGVVDGMEVGVATLTQELASAPDREAMEVLQARLDDAQAALEWANRTVRWRAASKGCTPKSILERPWRALMALVLAVGLVACDSPTAPEDNPTLEWELPLAVLVPKCAPYIVATFPGLQLLNTGPAQCDFVEDLTFAEWQDLLEQYPPRTRTR